MGSLIDELAKVHLDALDEARKLHEGMAETDALVDRARDLSELEAIFGRLGIDKKIASLKPDIEVLKTFYSCFPCLDEAEGYGQLVSLKRVIEFIECIDEP